jgi:hypothetical protein
MPAFLIKLIPQIRFVKPSLPLVNLPNSGISENRKAN